MTADRRRQTGFGLWSLVLDLQMRVLCCKCLSDSRLESGLVRLAREAQVPSLNGVLGG